MSYNKALISLVSLLLCGCQRQPLLVETEYVTERSLASHWVRTPDPKRECPPSGQRLFVSWRLPPRYLKENDLHIELTVRFGDNAQETRSFPISCFMGTYTYEALDDAFWDHKGIRTYEAKLYAGECLLERWRHALWAELIELDTPAEEDPSTE